MLYNDNKYANGTKICTSLSKCTQICEIQFLDFRNWWPGWNGEKAGNPAFNFDSEDFLGISMKRKFDFVKSRQNTQVTVERFIDYYFWGLQNLQSKLPFLCERTKKDIGCVEGLLKFIFQILQLSMNN